MPIFKPSELHEFLNAQGLSAKKHLSQNFLIDGNILKKIVKAADVKENEVIFEIGPGPGALTEELLKEKAHVYAIEMDKQLATLLRRLKTPDNHLEVIEGDCLTFDWEGFLKSHLPPGKKAKVVANLPYKITTPILSLLLPLYEWISSITVMVQQEVGVRFVAPQNSSDYSSFTVFLNFFSAPKYCFTISPNCFFPKPKISSALVRLDLKKPPNIPSSEKFFAFVRSTFQQRRKMLRASLKEQFDPSLIQSLLAERGLSELSRPEQLSLDDFLFLYSRLHPNA